MSLTRSFGSYVHFTGFVIFIIIIRFNSQAIYCSNQQHNRDCQNSTSPHHKSPSRILSATDLANDSSSSMKFNYLGYIDFPIENWLNLSSLFFNELSSYKFFNNVRHIIETTRSNPSEVVKPLSHKLVDDLLQVLFEEEQEKHVNHESINNRSSVIKRKQKSRVKREVDYELLHNVVNAQTGSSKRNRMNRELIEPQLIQSVNPQRDLTHMEMLALNGSSSPGDDPDFVHNKSFTTTTTKPSFKLRLVSSTKGSSRNKPSSSSQHSFDQASNGQPQTDSYASSTSFPSQYYRMQKLANTVESPLPIEAGGSTDFGNSQEPADENLPNESTLSENDDEKILDKGNILNDLYYSTESSPNGRGMTSRAKQSSKSSRIRAASLAATNGAEDQIDHPTTSSPQLQTQLSAPEQHSTNTNKDNSSIESNLQTQHQVPFSEHRQDRQHQASDFIVPQVGDDLVVDHSGKPKNVDPIVEGLKDLNPQILKQLIYRLENEVFAKKSMRPNRVPAALESSLSSLSDPIRSNAPYAAINRPSDATNAYQDLNQKQPSAPLRYHIESTSEPLPQTAPAIFSSNNPGASYIRYASPASMYSASVNNVIHQPITSRLEAIPPEVSSHIEENFYNTYSNKRLLTNKANHKSYQQPQISAEISSASGRYPLSQYWQSSAKYVSPLSFGLLTQRHMNNLLKPLASSSNGSSHYSSSSNLLKRTLPLILTDGYNHRFSSAATTPAATILLPAYAALPFSGTTSKYTKNLHGSNQRNMANSQHRIGRVANSQTNFDDSNGQSAATSSEPMWSDTQNQEDDYQQAPQTIQITAVPNGLGVNNGMGFNGMNGLNGWNGWGGPWNGRQVLLVNRQPAVGSEWSRWILPVLAVLALPVVLGSLLVPVFLKSVLFLIQILQMLGFLMPPSQLASHLASSSHNSGAG